MKMLVLLFLVSSLQATTVAKCKKLETLWITYDKMAGKAFLKELDITKAIKLKVLATNTAEEVLSTCPNEYWLSFNTEEDNQTVQFWKDDIKQYIIRNKKFIQKHDSL